jgi:hypothetical protein
MIMRPKTQNRGDCHDGSVACLFRAVFDSETKSCLGDKTPSRAIHVHVSPRSMQSHLELPAAQEIQAPGVDMNGGPCLPVGS